MLRTGLFWAGRFFLGLVGLTAFQLAFAAAAEKLPDAGEPPSALVTTNTRQVYRFHFSGLQSADAVRLAERFFAPEEIDALRNFEDRDQAFFGIWTAKEAYLKALGAGIALLPLNSFAVSTDPDAPSLLRADNDDPSRWQLSRARVPDGYLCTVALDITA